MRLPVNGIFLNVELAGTGAPVLLLHGFTGAASSWRDLAVRLAPRWQTIAVDLIGHGASDAPADPQRYRIPRCVEDLVALLDTLGLDRASVLGYSMGGRVALQLAAAVPERVSALVVESGSPGLATSAERTARIAADEQVAERIEREGLVAFVDYWERIPLFASQEQLPTEVRARLRAQRLTHNPIGLANSLRGMGTGRQPSLWDSLATLRTPTLIVAGEVDDKYRQIAESMAAVMPNARYAVIPGAGHAVHLEQPETFGAVVEEFLPIFSNTEPGKRSHE